MEKKDKKKLNLRTLILTAIVICSCIVGTVIFVRAYTGVEKVASKEDYGYVNPDETKAEADAGFSIDGVLDEKQYQDADWVYMHNNNGNSTVDLAMTSYFGEKGMYFAYDVSESTPIYVNLKRNSTLNSCVEMYLASSDVKDMATSNIFEIDLLPTGDMVFKQRRGNGSFGNVTTSPDKMAYLGATTKGGEVNTEDCYGYVLEFFIPWDYLEWLGMDSDSIKEDYVYVNPAHISSYSYTGTDGSADRYWYSFATQLGGDGWGNVTQYYKFCKTGAMHTVPNTYQEGAHCSITGDQTVIPYMDAKVIVTPEKGYALNSILVNNEEYIKKVSYNEDGSVTMFVEGTEKGLDISASAEKVSSGNKTLKGTVALHKMGGDSLKDVSASYTGPNGAKPLELDALGNFVLTDLKQGYYTITVAKEGYEELVRSVYLNRDMDVELTMEYQMFSVLKGSCWKLKHQNDGLIYKMAGTGKILSNSSYDKFVVEGDFHYDNQVAPIFVNSKEQRQGILIKFSNDTYWQIHLLYQGDEFKVQYAQSFGDKSIYKWKTVYTFTDEDVVRYKGEQGIGLKVERSGQYALVYLAEKLIAVEKLGNEYASLKAQLGFEGEFLNMEIGTVAKIPYRISNSAKIDLSKIVFKPTDKWDVSKQEKGIISLINGGGGKIELFKKYEDIDFTIRVKDDPRVETNGRTRITFDFDNKENVIFSVIEQKGTSMVQMMPCTVNNQKWQTLYKFTDEERMLFNTEEGIDFRVVRNGAEFSIYINGEFKAFVDLSKYIKTNTPATVSVAHDDDKGVRIDIPFKVTEQLKKVTINVKSNAGQVVTNKKTYVIGDPITLYGKDEYYCIAMKVNGKEVTLDGHGKYNFTAEENNYNVEATTAKRVFAETTNTNWNVLKQNEGVVTLPNGGNGGRLYLYDKYKNIDFTLTAKDDARVAGETRTTIWFEFDNKETINFAVYTNNNGASMIQMMPSTITGAEKWQSPYKFNADETAKFQSANGIDFRVVREGTEIDLYLDGVKRYTVNLATYNPEHTITAETPAKVAIHHEHDEGVQIDIPFKVADTLKKTSINIQYDKGGNNITETETYMLGEFVTLYGKEDYYFTEMKVDGNDVTLDGNGKYSFVAKNSSYNVEAKAAKRIFAEATNDKWNLLRQNEGVVTLPNGGSGGRLYFYDKYENIDLTLTAKDDPRVSGETRTTVWFEFDNKETVNFAVYTNNNGASMIQMMPSTIHGSWSAPYKFNADETAKFQSEDGIDFRIVRKGTELCLYLDGVKRYTVDLATFNPEHAITAETSAKVAIHHEHDEGIQIDIPFHVSDEIRKTTINFQYNQNGGNSTGTETYMLGEEVSLYGKGDYYFTEMKVDGNDVTLDGNGKYNFIAKKDSYNVEVKIAKRVFAETTNSNWNVLKQNEGVVTLPNGGSGGYLYLDGKYTDIDLTLTATDNSKVTGETRTTVWFEFDNGETAKFSLNGLAAKAQLQIMPCTINDNGWKTPYVLSSDEHAKLNTAEGIDFRIVREGTKFYFYFDGQQRHTIDLATYNSNHTIATDTPVKVAIHHEGDAGAQIDIPFSVSHDTDNVALYIMNNGDAKRVKHSILRWFNLQRVMQK